ncbi:hypothetical protein [Pedobacter sp. KLB.chiD]|uniref:hypothetical protein n=1 Tax=Pedobacter sp. KLB.chiD TaxID=3387402 RepID=UPI003999C5F7
MKRIVLITSGQPSLNPRLVKEADALVEAGYEVKVIYQYWNDWGTELDIELLKNKYWKAIRVGGSTHKQKLIYWYTRIQHKLATSILKLTDPRNLLAEAAIGRSTYLLTRKAQTIKADLYIGHNLAALPAVIKAAKKNNAKCGFDAEDFHRNEQSNEIKNFDVRLKTYVEDKYIRELNYISTSSPSISKAYKKLYPKTNPITILNVFPRQNLGIKTTVHKHLRLFWFSQTVGLHRGIETVIKAMGMLNNPKLELHLLGSCTDEIKTSFNKLAETNGLGDHAIFYYNPVPEPDIFNLGLTFDIGLATETDVPHNRDICLTNKIFTYIQSGLAVIASDTSAQKQFMQEFPNMGMVYDKNNAASLANLLKIYINDNVLLSNHQEQALKYVNEVLNWEVESKKFLNIVEQTLRC